MTITGGRILYNHMAILSQDPASQIFRALADPTRRQILQWLAADACSVGELVAASSLSQPGVTKHLGVLERSGLISRHHDGRYRRCQLRPDALALVSAWLLAVRASWEERIYVSEDLYYHEDDV